MNPLMDYRTGLQSMSCFHVYFLVSVRFEPCDKNDILTTIVIIVIVVIVVVVIVVIFVVFSVVSEQSEKNGYGMPLQHQSNGNTSPYNSPPHRELK